MVYKEVFYGNVPNVTVVEFGEGTVSIANGKNQDHVSLVMKTIEKHEIGEVLGKDTSSDEFEPEVVICFTNKESFDVFYEYVQNIKKYFEGIQK